MDKELIKKLISTEIADAKCMFEGDSCSLKLLVISKSFREIPLIEQHKMVYDSLEGKMGNELHALALTTTEK